MFAYFVYSGFDRFEQSDAGNGLEGSPISFRFFLLDDVRKDLFHDSFVIWRIRLYTAPRIGLHPGLTHSILSCADET